MVKIRTKTGNVEVITFYFSQEWLTVTHITMGDKVKSLPIRFAKYWFEAGQNHLLACRDGVNNDPYGQTTVILEKTP